MAVPTISSVTPGTGPTIGRMLLEVIGTGFKLPTIPPTSTEPVPKPAYKTVQALFGTVEALEVFVLSSTRLLVRAPALAAGTYDLTLKNRDQDSGVVVVGETVTEDDAYTAAYPKLRPDKDAKYEGLLQRVVGSLQQDFVKQLIAEVVITQHTDWDDDTGDARNVTAVAKLPAFVMGMPRVEPNRFYSQNELDEEATGVGSEFNVRREPDTVDLVFSFMGLSDNPMELLQLLEAVRGYFHQNKYFELARDPADTSAGNLAYEMDLQGPIEVASRPTKANVGTFTGKFIVRGFFLEDLAGFPGSLVLEKRQELDEDVALDVGATPES